MLPDTSARIVIAYVDFDPGGWIIAHALVAQLLRYAMECSGGPHFLVRAESFTAEEQEIVSIPLDPDDTWVIHWMAEAGGVGGQARGIHSNWLRPYERVQAELAKILATIASYQTANGRPAQR